MTDDQPERRTQEDTEIVVDDPEGYARTQQLQAVFRARDQFLRVRRRVLHQTPAHQNPGQDGVSDIFVAVQEMVLAVEPLLMATGEHDDLLETEPFVIDGVELVQRIPGFEEARKVARREAQEMFGDKLGIQDNSGRVDPELISDADKRRIRMTAARKQGLFSGVTIEGLRPFGTRDMKIAAPYSDFWRVQAPPVETSVDVFSRCQQAMSGLGLGFDLTEDKQDAEFEYSDLLNVDERSNGHADTEANS